MSKKIFLYSAAFLLALNFFCWREVFVLAGLKYLKVDFLNVGQGDSEFIETPQMHKILIDGGPDSAVLAKLNSFLPFWDRNIDVVILTHPEKDHMMGILDILQRYNVKYFLWTGVVKTDAENKKLAEILDKVQHKPQNFLLAALDQGTTKVLTVSAREKIKAGNVEIDILYPLENLAGKEMKNTSNDTGIVARLDYGENSFLFTGDISSKAEAEIALSHADVLKVAHHGSKYSSSELFLKSVSPKFAVISVGKNSYGHPTPEVLQRLEKYDITTLRTDQQGDIKFISDGNTIKISNF